MATDLCCEYVLDLATDLKMNEGGIGGVVTTIRPTSITGLDGRPIRATILPSGAADGGDKLTARFGPRLIRVEGEVIVYAAGVLVTPVEGVVAYLTAVNTLVNAWVAGLEAVLNTAFNLSFTPTGLSGVTKSVTYGSEGTEFQSAPSSDLSEPTKVSFGLVAETG
jgi:hypothetical protein